MNGEKARHRDIGAKKVGFAVARAEVAVAAPVPAEVDAGEEAGDRTEMERWSYAVRPAGIAMDLNGRMKRAARRYHRSRLEATFVALADVGAVVVLVALTVAGAAAAAAPVAVVGVPKVFVSSFAPNPTALHSAQQCDAAFQLL